MSARAYVTVEPSSSATQFREHSESMRWELDPEERVGRPLRPRRKRWWLRGIGLLALAGGGWTFAQDPAGSWEWTSRQLATAVSMGEALLAEGRQLPRPAETTPPLVVLAPLQLFDAEMLAAADSPAVGATDDPASNRASQTEPFAETQDEKPAEPAEVGRPAPLPPLPPMTDPLLKRAEAVGLHPELSRALLESLTAADFKNAGIAIKKAIAETPDDAVLVWPPQPKPGIARFHVHFVPGISAACRRYVVGVAKNGWLTTALPMERCGVKPKPTSSVRGEPAASIGTPRR